MSKPKTSQEEILAEDITEEIVVDVVAEEEKLQQKSVPEKEKVVAEIVVEKITVNIIVEDGEEIVLFPLWLINQMCPALCLVDQSSYREVDSSILVISQPCYLYTSHADWQKMLLFDNACKCGGLHRYGDVLSGWLGVW
jgi:hypothetical protein